MRYDPDRPVEAAEWLSLDEMERQARVEGSHKRAKVRLPSLRMHAIMHVAIENQLAEGHAAAAKALERLLAEGLDRHDAVHALGSVLATHMFEVMKHQRQFDEKAFSADLDALSAERWLSQLHEPEE
jgi:hypothetical protein